MTLRPPSSILARKKDSRATAATGMRERDDRTHDERACDDRARALGGMARIEWFANQGLLAEGREACADLLFDFQPLIAANGELLSRIFALFDRCGAKTLRKRLSLAVKGDACIPGPLARLKPDNAPLARAPVLASGMEY